MATKPIVAATDGSEESLRAVEWAAQEAVLRGAPLRIVSAAELLPRMLIAPRAAPGIEAVAGVLQRNRDHALAIAAVRAHAMASGLVIDTDALTGPIARAVTDSGSGASMLVVGSRGIGAFSALILGSVSRYAATHAACPVVVVRDHALVPRRQIGLGIRDADTCADALAFAFEEATLREACLIVVHAWHPPHHHVHPDAAHRYQPEEEPSAWLTALLTDWRDKYPGVRVSPHVGQGHPGRALAGLSAHADLVVIGRCAAHETGRHGPGNVTHALLNHAYGPVATVPSCGETPTSELRRVERQ
jgi:nucleotide-binding universal stress UspA family protein